MLKYLLFPISDWTRSFHKIIILFSENYYIGKKVLEQGRSQGVSPGSPPLHWKCYFRYL